jgi:hypothetical protein
MSIAGIAGDTEATAEEEFGYWCFVEPEWVLGRKFVWACREDWEQDEAPVGEIVRRRAAERASRR